MYLSGKYEKNVSLYFRGYVVPRQITTKGIGVMRQFIVLLMLCLVPATASWSADTLKFNTLRVGHYDDRAKVMVELSGPVKYKYFSLSSPDRFVVDLLDVIGTGSKPQPNFTATPIKNLRYGIRKGDDLRLVFELDQAVEGSVYLIQSDAGNTNRLVIEMAAKTPRRIAQAVVEPPVATQVEQTSAPQLSPVVPQVKKEIVITPPTRDIIVAIDAGHGGIDPGARGRKGTHEKDVTLAIARKLEKLVEREEGMRPLMIRDKDVFIKLSDRKEKARRKKADMFISIHADAFPDPRAKGASVYALSQSGATSEAAKLLANRENASDLVGGVSLDDKDDMLASVLLDLSQSATIEDSLDAASRVLKGLKGVAKIHKSHVQQAGFAVLKSPDIPSILVETAFISNPTEENNLRSDRYQQQLAEAMMYGIRSYFVSNPPAGTRIAREHVIKRGETLSEIASRYQVSLDTLRLANQLNSDSLRIGQVLHIPTSGS